MSIDYYRPSLLNIFRWKESIIPYVILPTLILTSFTAVVTVIYMKTNIKLSIPQSFTLILVTSFAIALLLTYRLNSACDKYWESCKTWSAMVCAIRNLTRFIWIDVKNVNKNDEKKEKEILIKRKLPHRICICFKTLFTL
ncbi:Bestrophin/UPF0187 [Gigaspora rosea]|uniref:Bestrophin/UPF0187 n=1 Tax=Gigaspora rosea TaxID=44941 RepID=A0A397U9H4_9GLOM|nr:Bestrophin/UPF0187 [Gigaspora rosea]